MSGSGMDSADGTSEGNKSYGSPVLMDLSRRLGLVSQEKVLREIQLMCNFI